MGFIFKVLVSSILLTAVVMVALFAYFNLPGPKPRKDVRFGVTFSQRYAVDLGLDWKQTYRAVLDDLGVRKLRIPIYWDLVEKDRGTYGFADVDWMLDEAEKRGAEVILVVGQRSPRWPECHIPDWVKSDGNASVREARLTDFVGASVTRYRDHPAVSTWQVENEPFVKFFGECPEFSRDFFDKELAYVRSLDSSRPILVTDSGEFSTWTAAAVRGDILGTTMYRKVHNPKYGYVTYPLGPNYYRFKAALIRLFFGRERFIVAELQAEPWASGWVAHAPIAEQYKTMNPVLLREYAEFARRVGFPEAYFWGVEWWYWLKETKGEPEVWEAAIELFHEREDAI